MNILIICNFINNLATKLLTLLEISEKKGTFAMIIKKKNAAKVHKQCSINDVYK